MGKLFEIVSTYFEDIKKEKHNNVFNSTTLEN